MDFSVDLARIRCLPRTALSKHRRIVRLQLLEDSFHESLANMYLAYQPRNSFQGLPPMRDEVCLKWVWQMIATGVNVVALSGREIIGHMALFPISAARCEMLVVVSPGYQNMGIGTELVRSCVQVAGDLGFEKIWLPVDATNVRARHIYKKCGFEYVSQKLSRELDMVCDLKAFRSAGVPLPLPHFAAASMPAAQPVP